MRRGAGRASAAAIAFTSACAALATGEARAAPVEAPVYTITIGQNEIARELGKGGANEGLATLHYADDDAAYFHTFMRGVSREAYLLSVLDADTQRRFPALVAETHAPTRAELLAVVERVKHAMQADRAAGREPVLVLFYSGHGVRDEHGAPGLALYDGALSQRDLYDDVLAALPAQFVHLIVDACHAEAVVRPRDAEAHMLAADEIRSYVQNASLARFPHVGAILASTTGAQSFEWDAYRGGVFAHEVLSGLRGAADVNGDGRIEYSELAAFVAAANLRISDPRARPQVVVQAPRLDRRAPIVDLGGLEGHFRLSGRAHGRWASPFYVETETGVRLVDAFPEPEGPIAFRLPAGQRLYVVRGDNETELLSPPGATVALESLSVGAPRARARGALDSAMRKGLFATAFGPAFYRGYVSQQPDLVSVGFEADDGRPPGDGLDLDTGAGGRYRTAGKALLGGGIVAAIGAGVFGGLAWHARSQYESTSFERPADDARQRYDRYSLLTWTTGAGAVALLGAGAALLYWPRGEAATAANAKPATTMAFTGSGIVVFGGF